MRPILVFQGEEMFSNYGDLSNEMLLFAYGFAIASNDHDRVAVTLTSSSDERLGTFYLHPSEDLSGIPKVSVYRVIVWIDSFKHI
jgi:hypothetical protein